jgi:hypothetical protein
MTIPPDVKIVRIAGHYEVLLTGNSTIYGEGATPELAFKNMMLKVHDYRLKNNSGPFEITPPLSSSYSGRFSVRLDHKLHHLLNLEAQKKGLSLNSLIIQKLSKDLEHLTQELEWRLNRIEVISYPKKSQHDFHLSFISKDYNQLEQKVLIFSFINIADTLGDEYGKPPSDGNFDQHINALSQYIQDTSSIVKAFERFLNDPEIRMAGKDTYRGYILRIKGNDSTKTVHDLLRRDLASNAPHGNISATELLEHFDEFIVFEV